MLSFCVMSIYRWLIRYGVMLIALFAMPSYAQDTLIESSNAENSTQPVAADTTPLAIEQNPATDTDSRPADMQRILPNALLSREQALVHQLRLQAHDWQLVELDAADERFPALYRPDVSGKKLGGALILHNVGQHPDWAQNISPTREHLSQYGWSTLSVSLPDALKSNVLTRQLETTPVEPPNPNEDQPDNHEAKLETIEANTASESQPPSLHETIAARVQAGALYLQQRYDTLVLIAYGQSAAWAIDYAQHTPDIVLVLIDPLEHPASPINITQMLSSLDIPVLDLLTERNRNTAQNNQQRAGQMRYHQRKLYRQIRLPAASADEEAGQLISRRIRGWLKTYAANKPEEPKEETVQ